MGGSLHTIKRNTEALVVSGKEIRLEVNADKTNYMVMSRDQNAGRNHSIKQITISLKVWNSLDIWEQT